MQTRSCIQDEWNSHDQHSLFVVFHKNHCAVTFAVAATETAAAAAAAAVAIAVDVAVAVAVVVVALIPRLLFMVSNLPFEQQLLVRPSMLFCNTVVAFAVAVCQTSGGS